MWMTEIGAGEGHAKRDLFIGDADAETAASSAELKRQLRESRLKAGSAPEAMVGDERTRRAAYPQPVLLGSRFVVMEQVSGRWQVSFLPVETATEARSRLLLYLRVSAPTWEGPGEQICAAYAHAADALERDGGYEIAAAERRFRIARFEQAVYMGADGPEPPRPSDIDPYLPPAAQMQQAPSEGPPDRPSGPDPGDE
jgi:uncharacterized protein DUF5954